MPDVIDGDAERLREKISAQSATPDDYADLAELLLGNGHDQESIDTLRHAITMPFSSTERASLMVALGWQVYVITWDIREPRALAEQALKLIEGFDTLEASVARARAEYLIARSISQEEPALASEMAYDLEDMEEAERAFQGAADNCPSTDPFHWTSLLWLAYSQYALG